MRALRVLCLGLGPIGLGAALLARKKDWLEIVAAVDIDPEKVDKDLGELCSPASAMGIVVSNDLEGSLESKRPDIVIHCTASFLPTVMEEILLVLDAGVNLVSSTEELFYPRLQHEEIAELLDKRARANAVTLLGTGVNPGFVMDSLAAFFTAICHEVSSVHCKRRVDASTRRHPFQKKIGAGLSEREFHSLAEQGKLGHIGLKESIAILGVALGFKLDKFEESLAPVLAETAYENEQFSIAKGQVLGIRNQGRGIRCGELKIEMDLEMYVGAADPRDEIRIEGTPPVKLQIPGG